jgi:serine/threonine protein kinase
MALASGTKLGPYEILTPLGAGGMGEIYLAEDKRLHRNVALKILPADVASNRDRMRRFEQEATAAAALNHPNIAHIYEIGCSPTVRKDSQASSTTDQVHFIAMEFIDGQTLRESVHRGQTDLRKLLRYLQHTAEGLAKAHAAGIVHRDLKPDNIMITRDGHAKILDFGLAKLIEPLGQKLDRERVREALSAMPTAVMPQHSQPGTVLGTVGYMSPEQAQGRVNEIDHRSDIFSFGCILFEAVTRHRAFEGKDALDCLHNIVHAPTPQIRDLNPDAPEDLQKIVRRCLAKDPEERYQSIKDVAIEIKDVRRELTDGAAIQTTVPPSISTGTMPGAEASAAATSTPSSLSTRPSSAEYIISGIKGHKATAAVIFGGLILAAVAIGYVVYRLAPKQTALSFQSAKFTRLTSTGKATAAAISPDGKWLVHVMDDGTQQSLWLRQVAIATSNTQIVPPAAVRYRGLAFSPDGNYVYYTLRESNSDAGTLYQMPVLGGTSQKILTAISSSVTFSPDGKRIAYFGYQGDEDRLMVANADGTGVRQLAGRHGDEFFYAGEFSCVSWSPNGKTLAAPVGSNSENFMSVVSVAVDTAEIKFFTPQRWQTVAQVIWLIDGNGLLVTAQEPGSNPFTFGIWQVSYPGGETRKITNDLNSYSNISLTSDGNLLAAVQIQISANIWVMPGFDGVRATQITQGTGLTGMPSWTRDDKIVYMSNAGGGHDLYLMDPRGGNAKQLTNTRRNVLPSASSDGRYIVFESTGTGVPHIWRMDADGENPRQITNGYDSKPFVSPDGQWIVYVNNANKDTIWRVGIDGGQPVQLTDKTSRWPVISPDGKQIACVYEEPNSPVKLAILPFEGGQPMKTLPLPNGISPTLRFTRDGRAIVYAVTRGGVTNLWAQPVDGSPPKQLTNFTADRIFFFDFSRDGKQVALDRGTLTRDVVLISNFK